MQMSEEMAARLHRMMWSDMQREFGDNICSGRPSYKEEWLAKHFPGEHFMHNCFLCEYVTQQTGNVPLLGSNECKTCPIKWPGDNCSLSERVGGVNYLMSPISEILALPARNGYLARLDDEKIVVDSYYKFREDLLSKASGIPATSAIEDHVKAIVKKAVEDKDKQLKSDRDTMSFAYCNAKKKLSEASGLEDFCTTEEHIKAIQEKAVQQSDFSKMYCDAKMELAKASGLPEADTITDHIKAIQEKAVDDYFAKMPLAKAMTTDIDEAFKQYAKEQMAPIFHALAKASGRHEPNHNVQDHIGKIIDKTRQESADCTRKFIAKYSGEFWDRLTIVGHIEKIKRGANAKYVYANSLLDKYKNALSDQSGLDRDKPIDVHLREIVKISMEVGATEERERIQERIEELLKE